MDFPVTTNYIKLPKLDNWKIRTGQYRILFHYIMYTLPQVKRLLNYWEGEALKCVNPELKKQALSSLKNKDFHCQGGAVFAVPCGNREPLLVELIVAYQTLCDYLDNLCDRTNCTDGAAFLLLHQALLDALAPEENLEVDYYREYPFRNDGGYINKLVEKCRQCISQLPSYEIIYNDVLSLANLYIKLQINKHISWENREKELIRWAENLLPAWPGILWQELAAASGSTLAVFALFELAARKDASQAETQAIIQTYFPWICGLHILLDYFIDREEDRIGGDLNFTFYYPDMENMMERFKIFINQAHQNARILPDPSFTETVIEGLLAMYLSDKKIYQQGYKEYARQLVIESGGETMRTLKLCTLVRKFY